MNKKGVSLGALGCIIVLGAVTWYVTRDQPAKDKIDENALYSDGTSNFISPAEPNKGQAITVQLRVKKDNITQAEVMIPSSTIQMKKTQSDSLFDYYRAVFPGSDQPIQYWFRVTNQQKKPLFFSRFGASIL